MRRLVLVLMLVLLPLRGWLGEAMATEMALTAAVVATPAHSPCADHAAVQAAHPAHGTHEPAAAAAPHAQHAAASPTADDTPHCPGHAEATAGDGPGCLGCQACHALALTADVPAPPAGRPPAERPAASPAAFRSAVPAPGLKPPIS